MMSGDPGEGGSRARESWTAAAAYLSITVYSKHVRDSLSGLDHRASFLNMIFYLTYLRERCSRPLDTYASRRLSRALESKYDKHHVASTCLRTWKYVMQLKYARRPLCNQAEQSQVFTIDIPVKLMRKVQYWEFRPSMMMQ